MINTLMTKKKRKRKKKEERKKRRMEKTLLSKVAMKTLVYEVIEK